MIRSSIFEPESGNVDTRQLKGGICTQSLRDSTMIGGLKGGSKDAEGCDLAFRNLKDQGEDALPETCCQYK